MEKQKKMWGFTNVEEVTEDNYPELHQAIKTVENKIRGKRKTLYAMREVYVGDQPHGPIASTDCISHTLMFRRHAVARLNSDELETLTAHEFGHLPQNHTPSMLLSAATKYTGIAIVIGAFFEEAREKLGLWGLATIAIPATLFLIKQALNRGLEYDADRFSVEVTEKPEACISFFRNTKNMRDLEDIPDINVSDFWYSAADKISKALWFLEGNPLVEKRISHIERLMEERNTQQSDEPSR